jgi:hypothetical protein
MSQIQQAIESVYYTSTSFKKCIDYSRQELLESIDKSITTCPLDILKMITDYSYFCPPLQNIEDFNTINISEIEALLDAPKSIYLMLINKTINECLIDTIDIEFKYPLNIIPQPYFRILLSPNMPKWALQMSTNSQPWVKLYHENQRRQAAKDLLPRLQDFVTHTRNNKILIDIRISLKDNNMLGTFLSFSKQWFRVDNWYFTSTMLLIYNAAITKKRKSIKSAIIKKHRSIKSE